MRIIIIGAGEVGFHVAKALSQDNFDITIVDIDPEKCRRASESLDVIAIEGNGASPKNLIRANVGDADFVLALTRTDEVNLIAANQAHELGAKKIIARLRNQQYTERESIIRPEKFGIDLVIHPERAACEEIVRLVRHPYASHVISFEGGRLQMMAIRIEKQSPFIGQSLRSVCNSTENFKFGVVAVLRDGQTIIPWGDFVFNTSDLCYFIFKTENLEGMLDLLEHRRVKTGKVMILGASKIGRSITRELQHEMNVRLIEKDRTKAVYVASIYEEAMIINADGTDIEFLKSENISEVDSYIAVTANEQTNLLSGLLAHNLGVAQSIVHLTTTEYLPIIQELGIGGAVSKNMSTVNAIIREIRSDQSTTSLVTLDEIDVEVVEFRPSPGSKITQKPLSDLDLPKESIVGVINHHGQLSIARGRTQISDEDTVLVFGTKRSIPKLKKLFKN